MTKQELIEATSAGAGLSAANTAKGLDALCNVIGTALAAGQEVSLPGVGKLAVKQVGERPGRNPATGETIVVAARKKVVFKVSSVLKNALNS